MEKINIYIVVGSVTLAIIIVCTWMILEAMKQDKKNTEFIFDPTPEHLYRKEFCDCERPNIFLMMDEVYCDDCFLKVKQ